MIEPGEIYIADFAEARPPGHCRLKEGAELRPLRSVAELYHYLNRCKSRRPETPCGMGEALKA